MVEANSDGRVVRFLEKPPEDEIIGDTINAGIYILERSVSTGFLRKDPRVSS